MHGRLQEHGIKGGGAGLQRLRIPPHSQERRFVNQQVFQSKPTGAVERRSKSQPRPSSGPNERSVICSQSEALSLCFRFRLARKNGWAFREKGLHTWVRDSRPGLALSAAATASNGAHEEAGTVMLRLNMVAVSHQLIATREGSGATERSLRRTTSRSRCAALSVLRGEIQEWGSLLIRSQWEIRTLDGLQRLQAWLPQTVRPCHPNVSSTEEHQSRPQLQLSGVRNVLEPPSRPGRRYWT